MRVHKKQSDQIVVRFNIEAEVTVGDSGMTNLLSQSTKGECFLKIGQYDKPSLEIELVISADKIA